MRSFRNDIPVRSNPRHRGVAIIYMVVLLVPLIGLASLAVDYGRVQVTKTQLRAAADAAALAGATQLPNTSNALTVAQSFASQNFADGTSVTLASTDVVFGNYSGGSGFVANGSPTNAIKVTVYRAAAKGNAVPLLWGAIIGRATFDLSASAIATHVAGQSAYGLIGLNGINLNSGTTKVGEYNSATGTFIDPGSGATNGSVATNGNYNINASAAVGGTIYYGTGSAPNGGTNYVAKTQLTSTLSYPQPSAGSAATTNDNASLGLPSSGANASFNGGTINIPGGTYYLNSLNLGSSAVVNFQGPVVIYVNGNVTISGALNTYQNKPLNLQIDVVTSSGVNLNPVADLYAVVNASTSPGNINPSGTHRVIGSLICSQLDISGSGRIYYDTALGSNAPGGGTGTNSLSQ